MLTRTLTAINLSRLAAFPRAQGPISSAYVRYLERGMGRIWIVTDGSPNAVPLAYFSAPARAEQYRDLLVERYGLGRNLSANGQPLARDAGAWELGLGPVVSEKNRRRLAQLSTWRVVGEGRRITSDDRLPIQHAVQGDEICRPLSHGHSRDLPGVWADSARRARWRAKGNDLVSRKESLVAIAAPGFSASPNRYSIRWAAPRRGSPRALRQGRGAADAT